jgi:carboxyl-terminal processing protease
MNSALKALLILQLPLLLLAPSCLQQEVERGVKTAEQYWADTGLGSQELEDLLSSENCDQNEQSFLACVNSVSQMAEKYGLVMLPDGGFRKLTVRDIEEKASEKKALSKWAAAYRSSNLQISFLAAWKSLDVLIPPAERSAAIAEGINGFLSVFKDPHTYIMPLALYEEVIAASENKNSNAGFVARKVGSELMVRKVLEKSPAEKAGLRKGDRIQVINGNKVSEMLPTKINDLVKMRNTERLGLKVRRGYQSKYLEIQRSESVFPSVASRILQGQRRVGILTIHKFSKGTCQMARKQLAQLKEQSLRGLLLDLRDNPGGQVDEAACVVNLFVPRGTLLFETRYLDASKPSDRYVAGRDMSYQGPLAVLVNSGSASASEIVAGALRDQNRAKLVGERTYGKGTFQDGRIWVPNPKIAFFQTEGLYYFPSGWTPQLSGLQPDVAVNFNAADDFREADLFWNPLVPVDTWSGLQALSWLTERECELDQIEDAALISEDPQMAKAQALLSCGEKNERHGSL